MKMFSNTVTAVKSALIGRFGGSRDISYPPSVGIETINYCNAECIFCPAFQGPNQMNRTKRPVKVMDLGLFEKIAREVSGWEQKPNIYLNGVGEPLLDPTFKEKLNIVAKYDLGRWCMLQTNASLLTEEMGRAIIAAKIRVVFPTCDGATAETFESHRVGLKFDTVVKNIKDFARLRNDLRAAETAVTIKFVRTWRNNHEEMAAYNLFKDVLTGDNDSFSSNFSHAWNDSELKKSDFIMYKWDDACESEKERVAACSYLDSLVQIRADGSISACAWDYNLEVMNGSMGNVSDDNILGIYKGSAYKKLRKSFGGSIGNFKDACKHCMTAYESSYPPPEYISALAKNLKNVKYLHLIGYEAVYGQNR